VIGAVPATLEDILDAFALEEHHAKPTLDRYLTAYPQFAGELIDLSRELLRADAPVATELASGDAARIDAAWIRHAAARPAQVVNPFAALSPTRSREIAAELGVPRQVLTSFRERRILPGSAPQAFVRRIAAALAVSADAFRSWLASPPDALVRSYRADGQPAVATQVTFERVLIDAGVPEPDRTRLLADED
jgi:hypothetical protein